MEDAGAGSSWRQFFRWLARSACSHLIHSGRSHQLHSLLGGCDHGSPYGLEVYNYLEFQNKAPLGEGSRGETSLRIAGDQVRPGPCPGNGGWGYPHETSSPPSLRPVLGSRPKGLGFSAVFSGCPLKIPSPGRRPGFGGRDSLAGVSRRRGSHALGGTRRGSARRARA